MSFVFFGTHIFGDKTLQLQVHLLKLIMNREYLSSTRLHDLAMHGSSFKNIHFVRLRAKELFKLNDTINRLSITLYYS